jgi:hypothetical protein
MPKVPGDPMSEPGMAEAAAGTSAVALLHYPFLRRFGRKRAASNRKDLQGSKQGMRIVSGAANKIDFGLNCR